jgi:hypothetical protein
VVIAICIRNGTSSGLNSSFSGMRFMPAGYTAAPTDETGELGKCESQELLGPAIRVGLVLGGDRAKFKVLTSHFCDLVSGIEGRESPHELAAAIARNNGHHVQIVAKELQASR